MPLPENNTLGLQTHNPPVSHQEHSLTQDNTATTQTNQASGIGNVDSVPRSSMGQAADNLSGKLDLNSKSGTAQYHAAPPSSHPSSPPSTLRSPRSSLQ